VLINERLISLSRRANSRSSAFRTMFRLVGPAGALLLGDTHAEQLAASSDQSLQHVVGQRWVRIGERRGPGHDRKRKRVTAASSIIEVALGKTRSSIQNRRIYS
jgi:hypothetical protein